MRRAVLSLTFILSAVLAAGAAFAQAAADNDTDYVLPPEQLFETPDSVSWGHTYVALWWLAPMIAVSALVLWITKWIDEDAHRHGVNPVQWNYGTVAACLASLVAWFVLPPWLTIPAMLGAFALVLWKYIPVRNEKVLPTRRLFTPEHRERLMAKALGVFGIHARGMEQRLAKIAKTHVPVAVFHQAGRVMSPAEAPPAEEDPMTSVKEVLGQAVKRHAREAEIVPRGGRIEVSYKIDGVMHAGPGYERLRGAGLMLTIKKLVKGPEAASQFRIQLPTLNVSCTVDLCVYDEGDAEWMRLRLRADDEKTRRFAGLGLSQQQSAAIKRALEQEKGLIAVASPREMGARTTIYAMLDSLDAFSRNIVSWERPVAGRLESIEQNDLAKTTQPLADILAEAIRKDYDVLMLSELPDRAPAQIALSAAEREQLFIAHFELSDAVSVVRRLIDLGVEPQTVARGLRMVVAGRLVRQLCPTCRVRTTPAPGLLQKIGVDPAQVEFLYEESTGCDSCGSTAFHGRTGVFEVWQPSEASRRLIAQNAPAEALHAAALRDGMASLQHSGLMKVIEGVTSLRELARALKIGQQGN